MKIPNNPKCGITAERNSKSVLLIYHLYKAIHMDALTMTVVAYLLVTVNDFHQTSQRG